MKVFNVILGVFAFFGAFYCIFRPGITFLSSGWVVAILLVAWGLCSLFSHFSNKKAEKSKSGMLLGILGIIGGLTVSVFCLLNDFRIMTGIIDAISLIVLWVWMFLSGIDSIATAVRIKKNTQSKWWIFTLIMGILLLLGVVYGLFHALFMMRLAGFLIGYMLIAYGVRLIASAFESTEE